MWKKEYEKYRYWWWGVKGLKDTRLSNLKDKPWNFQSFLVGTQVRVSSIFLGFPDSSLVSIYSSWLRELLWEVSCLWALHNHPAGTRLRDLDSNLTASLCNFFCGQDNQLTKCLSSPRSKPWEWPASNFSLQYYGWIIHWDHENIGNDRHPKKLWLLNEFSLLVLKETYREVNGEYGYWC